MRTCATQFWESGIAGDAGAGLRVMWGWSLGAGEAARKRCSVGWREVERERHDLNSANELKLRFFGHPRSDARRNDRRSFYLFIYTHYAPPGNAAASGNRGDFGAGGYNLVERRSGNLAMKIELAPSILSSNFAQLAAMRCRPLRVRTILHVDVSGRAFCAEHLTLDRCGEESEEGGEGAGLPT